MILAKTKEDSAMLQELTLPAGRPGSGRRRYAAAMYFNGKGLLSDSALEVFRVCSALDGEAPDALLRERGLGHEIPAAQALSPEMIITGLVGAVDAYIASHASPGIAEARAGLAQWQQGAIAPVEAQGNALLDRWLSPALDSLRLTHPSLADAIGLGAPLLRWITYDGYPIDQIGHTFASAHTYASIIGESDAPIAARDWDMGLFLIAPQILYRDRRHLAPELYLPLTGPHGWRFGTGQPMTIVPAHRPVWNEPQAVHMTKVGSQPFLCLYVWTKDVGSVAEVIPAKDWPALEALQL